MSYSLDRKSPNVLPTKYKEIRKLYPVLYLTFFVSVNENVLPHYLS